MKKYESGGLIKSKEVVRGDSPLNDNKTIKVSGGEIVVKKSVVEKGLPAIMEFVKNELSKSSHEDKKNYDSGGTVNQKYIDLANYFNGGAQEAPTKGASAQQKVVTPPNQRIKELDAVRTNLRPLNSSEQQEYNTLTATQSAGGYAEGGTVPEDFDPDKYIAEKTAKIAEKTAKSDDNGFDPDKYIAEKSAAQSQPEMSQGKAALTGLQSGAAMGARPFISGLAAGAGGGVGAYQMAREKGKGLLDSAQEGLENAKKSFHQGKVEANEEEATAAHEYPKTYLASQLGGGALTVPFTPGGLAGAVGTGAGIGAANTLSENDPTLGSAAKNIAGGAALGGAGYGAGKAIAAGAAKVAPYAKSLGLKAAEELTGIPSKTIQTYANHADEISQMAKSSDNNVAEAADEVRRKFSDAIQSTKQDLNSEISSALKDSNKTIPVSGTIKQLETFRDGLNPDIHTQDIDQIDKIISKLKGRTIGEPGNTGYAPSNNALSSAPKGESLPSSDYELGPSGTLVKKTDFPQNSSRPTNLTPYQSPRSATDQMPLKDAHELKQYIQGIVSDSYRKPGDIFTSGSRADSALKGTASNLRTLINEAEPRIAKANNSLSELHDIEDSMNKNLISEGKPEAALLAAGSGGNQRNANILKRLSDLTGTNMNEDAEKLSAMRTFGKPAWTPVDTTGKSNARIGLGRVAGGAIGGGIGYAIGGEHGAAIGAGAGALAGGAATSPAVIKGLIKAGELSPYAAKTLGLLSKPAINTGILNATKKDQ